MRTVTKRKNQVRVHASIRLHAASRGNTLLEYGITGALVMVICIIGLQFLNGSLSTAMAMIRDDMQSKQKSAETYHKLHVAGASGQSNGTLSVAQQALLQESLDQKLQTTGANGSTEVLASQLGATAALLLAEGKIDQNQFDILMQLSNQGHKMAQIEDMFSQAITMTNGNLDAMSKMTFTLDGQTYSATDLAGLLGYNGPTAYYFAGNSVMTDARDSANPETAKFMDLYQQALASGALNDPLARSTVDSAATQIASISELVESTPAILNNGEATDNSAINAINADVSTHMNSSKICKTGKFQDNGVLCTP